MFGFALLRDAVLALVVLRVSTTESFAPEPVGESVPTLRVGALPADLKLDGVLDEPGWRLAPAIENLTMVEPVQGAEPTYRTTVRVLADSRQMVIGVRCFDDEIKGIVSYAVARDASIESEDHVRIVLGTFQDGRTGYVFAVNPGGARYDALVARRGEGEDSSWDGIWEAATSRDAAGWGLEVRIPIRTLNFKEGLDAWHFNVGRKVQRLLESSRWAGARLDWRLTQTAHAGLLTGLPQFDLGWGLAVRPGIAARESQADRNEDREWELAPNLDVSWKPTPDLTVQLTANTDFAETEVDTRRTNLTRFPLFFPEKRAFFLEGVDLFDFGLGLDHDLTPYHSRRIGLVDGQEVSLLAGSKVYGRIGRTSIGGLVVQTGHESGVAPSETMSVMRIRRDVLEESTVGVMATAGDPLGRGDSYLTGADFTYQTSRFLGDKNFLLGVWGLTTDREDLEGDSRSAIGGKIDYPNDLWDIVATWKRIGEDFDPSLGFVPRRGIHTYRVGVEYMPRPRWNLVRQMFYELSASYVTDLDHRWETYRLSASPLKWEFESGDEVELEVSRHGDRPEEDFEVGEDVASHALWDQASH
ncbi:MAG: DUF5916 domain-containing protein [Planctomycetota bacterium]